jgi:hypothetical protein
VLRVMRTGLPFGSTDQATLKIPRPSDLRPI